MEDELLESLLRRAQKAADESEQQQRRAARALRRALHGADPGELVFCAWCGRFSVNGRSWIELGLLGDFNIERLRADASHGICPACYERVSEEADRQRGSGA